MRSHDHLNKLVRPTAKVQPILAAGNGEIEDGDLFERDEPEDHENELRSEDEKEDEAMR